jgi:hypothetical protein
MGPIGCSETSAQNYHSTLRNVPEEGRRHLHRGGSLKSRKVAVCLSRKALPRMQSTRIHRTGAKACWVENKRRCLCATAKRVTT